jgi:hypothetical protein
MSKKKVTSKRGAGRPSNLEKAVDFIRSLGTPQTEEWLDSNGYDTKHARDEAEAEARQAARAKKVAELAALREQVAELEEGLAN